MKFNSVLLASIFALTVIACGGGDDKAKNDPGKKPIPEKTQECIAAGDACKLEGDKWVVHNKDGDKNTDTKDEPPVSDSAFDYSDIGVTDQLKAEKRGFGFWHKGAESPLNTKSFKNNPTQSPTIQWSSSLNYDKDLYNFVAITLETQDKNAKNKPKYMFDKIGEVNQKENQNNLFFGKEKHTTISGEISVGQSSFDYATPAFHWNILPAVVNTFMYRNGEGGWSVFSDPKSKVFFNQEEDTDVETVHITASDSLGKIGTGATKARVYGVNAFLEYDTANFANVLKPDGTAYAKKDDAKTYDLSSSRSEKPIKHANFVWYKLSNKEKRIQKSTIEGSNVKHAISKYDGKDKFFPTDVQIDELKYTQFGRLTGEGIDPEAERIEGYDDELLREYKFSESGLITAAGNKNSEDWYFARGTEPTPVATLDNYKAAGKKVVYDGQAVMFGIDYDPRKPVTNMEKKENQSTNAVKPIDALSKQTTLLDGKQNFVRLVWEPSTGNVTGSVYGVWTRASYWKANKAAGTVTKGQAIPLHVDNGKVTANVTGTGLTMDKFTGDPASDKAKLATTEGLLTTYALRIEPYFNPLVTLSGKVNEGTNSFGGKATREKDQSKGLFHGAFFGKDGSEVAGVINSQTGSFKDANLVDPAAKWGGAFGAKNQKSEVPEDLVFTDTPVDYATSTEFFTPGK